MHGRRTTEPQGLELDHASPERLGILFRDWPPVERQGARARIEALLGDGGRPDGDGECVRITRLPRCLVVERRADGSVARVPVPAGF